MGNIMSPRPNGIGYVTRKSNLLYYIVMKLYLY